MSLPSDYANMQASMMRQQEEAPRKVTVDVLERLLHDHMAFYVDWAALNPHSPDHVQDYKPEYPAIIKSATEAIAALRRIQR